MWKYTELNAFDSISLHDCKASKVVMDGNDLVIYFPDGFWITPASRHIDHDKPSKTGPAQVRFHTLGFFPVLDSVDIYHSTKLFGKEILCRRLQPAVGDFLRMINTPCFELEFISEYYNTVSALFECWIWRKNYGMYASCQLHIMFKSIEYCWNKILPDQEW